MKLARRDQLFGALGPSFHMSPREVAQVARVLREADQFPRLKTGPGDKWQINPVDAATLMLGLSTAPTVADAGLVGAYYACLENAEGDKLAHYLGALIEDGVRKFDLTLGLDAPWADLVDRQTGETMSFNPAPNAVGQVSWLPHQVGTLRSDGVLFTRTGTVPGDLIGDLGGLFRTPEQIVAHFLNMAPQGGIQ